MIQPLYLEGKEEQQESIQLITDIKVIARGRRGIIPKSFRALIDTGADHCGLSDKVARELKLIPFKDKGDILTVSGEEQVLVYRVDLELTCQKDKTHTIGFRLNASEFPEHKKQRSENRKFDFILGMDVLSYADTRIISTNSHVYYKIVIPGEEIDTGMRGKKTGPKGYSQSELDKD